MKYIVIILLGAYLFITNPTSGSYTNYFSKDAAAWKIENEKIIDNIKNSTSRYNFIIFSIYKTRLEGDHIVFGMANSFIPLYEKNLFNLQPEVNLILPKATKLFNQEDKSNL